MVKSFFWFAAVQLFVMFVAIGLAGMGFGGLFGAQNSQQSTVGEWLLLCGLALALMAGLLFVMGLATGVALQMGWGWGKGLARWTSYLSLLEVPVGTAFAIYWLRNRGKEAIWKRS